MDENRLVLTGRVDSPILYSHCVLDTVFVRFFLAVERRSGTVDRLPMMSGIRLMDDRFIQDSMVRAQCQLRSYAFLSANGVERTMIHAFIRSIEQAEEGAEYHNEALLSGRVFRTPVYRRTPLGREITDLSIASERSFGKTDVISAICWGRNANRCSSLQPGDALRVSGRFQSRDYIKRLPTGETLNRTAYELSVAEIDSGLPL